MRALREFLGVDYADIGTFFSHFEAKSQIDYGGLRFYPIPQVIELNAAHWLPDGKPFPLIIATAPCSGAHLCIDPVRSPYDLPFVLYPASLDLKGKRKQQLEKAGQIVARHLLEFMRKLVANQLQL